MKNNYPCRCGHLKSVHKLIEWKGRLLDECSEKIERFECSCYDFKGDNLRYLESLSE